MNSKIKKLKEFGLNDKTLSPLSESQINQLYSKLIAEQPQPGVTTNKVVKDVVKVTDSALNTGTRLNVGGAQKTLKKVPGGVQIEAEFKEKKESKVNPFAACNASIAKIAGTPKRSEWSKEHLDKYKKCAEKLKESRLDKNKNVSLQLEEKIMELVKKHVPPRMTKSEIIKYVSENSPSVAPSKPDVKPAKPGTKTPPKPRPAHPLRNPRPGEKEAPRAKSPEKAKEDIIDAILAILKDGKNEK
jgi:hypothetical protein